MENYKTLVNNIVSELNKYEPNDQVMIIGLITDTVLKAHEDNVNAKAKKLAEAENVLKLLKSKLSPVYGTNKG